MSFKNFVPVALSEKINTDLSRTMVFYDTVNHEYEGKAKEIGDVVKILNGGKPQITTYNDGKLHAIDGFEKLNGSAMFLPIDHVSEYAFKVDDLDKAQSAGSLYSTYMQEAKDGIADEMDYFIASLAVAKNVKKNTSLGTSAVAQTADGGTKILNALDECLVELYEHDVKQSTDITAVVTPKMWMTMKKAYRDIDTNNSELLARGILGRYNGLNIKVSNNVYKDDSGYEYAQIKTNKAIAFAKPYVHVEPKRIEEEFTDAVCGYAIFGGEVIRPKEIVTLKAKF